MNINTQFINLANEHNVRIIELDTSWSLIIDPLESWTDNTERIKFFEHTPEGDVYQGARKLNLYRVR